MLSTTAQKALDAYGGSQLWQNSKYLEAEISVSGLLFTLKRRPVFNHAKIIMEIAKPFSRLSPIGKETNNGETGSTIDIATRKKLIAKNKFDNNKEYYAGTA